MLKKAVRRIVFWGATAALLLFAIKQVPDGYQVAARAYQSGDFVKAMNLWKKLAIKGDDEAQYNVGALYIAGDGVEVSELAAQKYFLMSAENGNAAAQYELGKLYEAGRGVNASLPTAVIWIKKSADQGYAAAQMDIGLKYLTGIGVEQSADKAAYWLSQVVGEDRTPPVLIGSVAGAPCNAPQNSGS